MAGPGAPKSGGRQTGTPNKIGADVRAMVLAALDQAGGVGYLVAQAHENPKAFLTLVGRIIPTQITGPGDKDLIPSATATPDRVAAVFLALTEKLPRARIADSRSDDSADDESR